MRETERQREEGRKKSQRKLEWKAENTVYTTH